MRIIVEETSAFNPKIIPEVLKENKIIELKTHSLPRTSQLLLSEILSELLKNSGYESYFGKLNYCISEISSNALKANLKRLYFEEKKLDINNLDQYQKGMESFKSETFSRRDYFFNTLEKSDYYIIFSIKYENDGFIIEVRNNAIITEVELQRVKQRFANAHQITTAEFSGEFIDESEGAGLGIRSILLALKSFGLNDDHYKLFVDNNETVSQLIIERPLFIKVEEPEDLDVVEDMEELDDLEEI